jgi:hypothetical protein
VFGAIGFIAAPQHALWGDKAALTSGFCGHEADDGIRFDTVFYFTSDMFRKVRWCDAMQDVYIWMGGLRGGLAIGTIGLMVLISAMNGLKCGGQIGSTGRCLSF